MGIVQALAETTDPINYAPYWFSRRPNWDSRPRSVLMTEGLLDQQTPPDTAEALAAAGQLPVVSPAAHLSTAHTLWNDPVVRTPAMSNRLNYEGKTSTAGLAQFDNEDHFVIFYNEQALSLIHI